MERLEYHLLTKPYLDSTVDCVTKVFLYDEPMTQALGMSEAEFQTFVRAICEKAVNDKSSYICGNNKRVIGFALNEDLVGEPLPESVEITPKMSPILNLLGKLDKTYLKGKRISKGTAFHLFMIGSLREYRNKGIAKKLTDRSLALARRQGFDRVITEATNRKSQRLLGEYFGFRDRISQSYKYYRFGNKTPFSNIGEESCILMELKLR